MVSNTGGRAGTAGRVEFIFWLTRWLNVAETSEIRPPKRSGTPLPSLQRAMSGARRLMPASPSSREQSPVRPGTARAFLVSGSTKGPRFHRMQPTRRRERPTGDILPGIQEPGHGGPPTSERQIRCRNVSPSRRGAQIMKPAVPKPQRCAIYTRKSNFARSNPSFSPCLPSKSSSYFSSGIACESRGP
jgi:hypothetical protein